MALFVFVPTMAKLTLPSPATADVISTSTHVPRTTAPIVAMTSLLGGGALVYVMPVSVQAPVTSRTLPPAGLASVTHRRSLAETTALPVPVTANRRYGRYSGSPALEWSVVRVPPFALGALPQTWASATGL